MVRFFEDLRDVDCTFVVIIAQKGGKLVFCRHRERATWEFPGGHIEAGESALQAAKRELNEETGATEFEIERGFGYGVDRGQGFSYGIVFVAQVSEFGDGLDMEIGEIAFMDGMPCEMTYPDIQPELLEEAKRRKLI